MIIFIFMSPSYYYCYVRDYLSRSCSALYE